MGGEAGAREQRESVMCVDLDMQGNKQESFVVPLRNLKNI